MDPLTWSFTEQRFFDLLNAPLHNPDMIWMVLPLGVALIAMQFYFGRYSKEELGWDSFVSNTIVLFFVAIDLLRHIYNLLPADPLNFFLYPFKTTAALIVAVESVTLFFADFFHFLPKKLAFLISSPLPVNLTAYVAMTIVYSDIPLDVYTLYAALLLFILLFIASSIIQHIVHYFWEAPQKE